MCQGTESASFSLQTSAVMIQASLPHRGQHIYVQSIRETNAPRRYAKIPLF